MSTAPNPKAATSAPANFPPKQVPAQKAASKAISSLSKPKPLPATKPVSKAAAKPPEKTLPKAVSTKIAVKTTAKPASKTSATAAATPDAAKTKKAKLVRDSFTIPKAEYYVLESLKLRSVKMGKPAKKSEILRAGIKALAAMSDSGLAAALVAVPTIKTGRPKLS